MGKPIGNVKINCGASWNKHLRKFSKRIYNKRLRKSGKQKWRASCQAIETT